MKLNLFFKIFALVFALGGQCFEATAQTPGSVWLDYGNDANGEGKIFKTDYGFITFCGWVPDELDHNAILVTLLDNELNIIDQKPYLSSIEYWGLYYGNCVVADSQGGFYLMANHISMAGTINPMLFYFDEFGDSLWTKQLILNDGENYGDFILSCEEDSLYCFGSHTYTDFTNWKHVMLKLDLQGNILFQNELNGGYTHYPYACLKVNTGFIVGGQNSSTALDASYNIWKQYHRKYSNNGSVQWTRYVHSPPAGAEAPIVALIQLDNGNYFYAGGRSEGTLSGNGETSNTNTQPVIGEIDFSDGDTLWEKGFNIHRWQQKFFQLKKTNDGGFIGVGTHVDDFDEPGGGWPVGFIIKIDSDFNEVWYHAYVPSIWQGIGRWNNLTDIVENDNGTFTALGMIYTDTSSGPQSHFIQDTYLITVDSDGCLVAGCGVGISEMDENAGLFVYPNPASHSIHVNLPQIDNYFLSIYDGLGEVVLQVPVRQSVREIMDIDSFTSGLYTLVCKDSKGKIWSQNFLKE